MKRNSLILSILTIVLCATLIAGSSFALFTSESKVNVAVTAGTVKVTATATTPTKTSTLGNNVAETTASLTDNAISLGKIVPGDVFTFDIIIHNESDVTVNYRTVLKLISGEKLWGGLKVTVEQKQTEDVPSVFALDTEEETDTVATPFGTMIPGCDDITLHVTVTLPVEAGNEYQGESCTFAYVVEAVQGNGEFDTEYVYTIPQLRAAAAAGRNVVLMNDLTFADSDLDTTKAKKCMLLITKDMTIDLNGKKLQYTAGNECPRALWVTRESEEMPRGATLNIKDSSVGKTGAIISNSSASDSQTFLVYAAGESTVNIYGGNFRAIRGSIIYKNNAHINIYGGRFETDVPDQTMLNCGDRFSDYGPIMIYGGWFKNFKPGETNGAETAVPEPYRYFNRDNGWYEVCYYPVV